MATKKTEVYEIQPVAMRTATVRIRGTTPLIVHNWSEKAKKQMLDSMTGDSKGKKKEAKNPVEEFIDSLYWITPPPGEKTEEGFAEAIEAGARFGFPAVAVKAAAINAAYRMGWAKDKVSLRASFFIDPDSGDLLEIHGEPPFMREDPVTVGISGKDLRYRGQFDSWYIDINLRYNENSQYKMDSILSMIQAGGYACGIGEWRIEKGGINGAFTLSED